PATPRPRPALNPAAPLRGPARPYRLRLPAPSPRRAPGDRPHPRPDCAVALPRPRVRPGAGVDLPLDPQAPGRPLADVHRRTRQDAAVLGGLVSPRSHDRCRG